MALSKFGSGIEMPMAPYRFRIQADATHITNNTQSVTFDFSKDTITLVVRQSVTAKCFRQALGMARNTYFTVEALDGTSDGVLFAIRPMGLELIKHTFELNYGSGSEPALHTYLYSYRNLDVGEPVGDLPPLPSDPNFPTPAEVAAKLAEPEVLELDLEQEMRITPDHPDTDGDGVPDALDKAPKDPKKQ